MTAKKLCLECNETVVGRTDKKFCTDYCRNTFNNRNRSEQKLLIREIDKKLHLNHAILNKYCPSGKTKTVALALQSDGFDFDFFTNLSSNGNGHTYYFCYDFGYCFPNGDDYVIIVKKEK